MKRTVWFCFILLAACLSSSACNKGTWVDFPMAECSNIPQFKTAENAQYIARGVCSNVGKAFTGDVRCEKNAVQIKCE